MQYHANNVDQKKAAELARFDQVLSGIEAKIFKLAPYAEAERQQIIERAQAGQLRAEGKKRKQKFSLMDLDFVTRHKILTFAIDGINIPVFLQGWGDKKPTPIPLPPLTRTRDARLRLESLLVTIEQTTLNIPSVEANEAIQTWLSHIDFTKLGGETSYETGFDAVKGLRFSSLSHFPHNQLEAADAPSQEMQLMAKCKNLKALKLTFVDKDLVVGSSHLIVRSTTWTAKPVDQLRTEYHLDGILSMKELENIDLQVHLSRRDHYYWGGEVNSLGEWFEAEFEKRGRKVRVYTCEAPK